MKSPKRALIQSVFALILCLSMLVGTTYAWFTDTETSMNNLIVAGNLDIEMYWNTDMSDNWTPVDNDAIFDYDRWEPGYTEVRYVKIVNEGNLSLKYLMKLYPLGEVGTLADVIDVYYVESPTAPIGDRNTLASLAPIGVLSDVINELFNTAGKMEPNESIIIGIALKMQESAGNEYKKASVGDSFTIQLMATQLANESDAFGNSYDSESKYPAELINERVSAPVENENGAVKNDTPINGRQASAIIPAGVELEEGVDTLTLNATEVSNNSNITLNDGQEQRAVDVHIDGVSKNNTIPMPITLPAFTYAGLNAGNVNMVHIEDDVNVSMTPVDSIADLATHNDFYYDPATGDVTVFIASFSVVKVTVETAAPWTGGVATRFAGGTGTENDPYIIANADQLAYFAASVGGMAKNSKDEIVPADNYEGKFIQLSNNINLGDRDNANESIVFTPVGYYYTDDKNNDGVKGDYYSTVNSFEGTFDGNGKTISNFYQNTWEIKGDYDGNYYKDAMGLFGYVYNGTVKNLMIDNFSSDGEFTPTGVIAAYAHNSTFINISITNCNPRVYNTGNGGIIGIAGNNDDTDDHRVTLENITVDKTNKITALWGSWDVACGGLIGMFRGAGHAYLTNCHVDAQIDVYNDVCGNYQYYWYRYAGMLIGANKNETTDENGNVVPETHKYHLNGCTVNFGDWNDYYYCELVANSLASYTHDHQFSRLTEISSRDEIWSESNQEWTKTGNFIVVSREGGVKNVDTSECYHIVKDSNGAMVRHTHDKAGTEVVDNVEGVLKEDKQIINLPFNQIFAGYGWGVKNVPYTDWYDTEKGTTKDETGDGIIDLMVNSGEARSSEEKFTLDTTHSTYDAEKGAFVFVPDSAYSYVSQNYTLGSLFNCIDTSKVNNETLQITISIPRTPSTVTSGLTAPISKTWIGVDGWAGAKLNLNGVGEAVITITDYYFCKPTTATVILEAPKQSAYDFENEDTFAFMRDVTLENGLIKAFRRDNSTIKVSEVPEDSGNKALGINFWGSTDTYIDFYNNTSAGENFEVEFKFYVEPGFRLEKLETGVPSAEEGVESGDNTSTGTDRYIELFAPIQRIKQGMSNGSDHITVASRLRIRLTANDTYEIYDSASLQTLMSDIPKGKWVTVKTAVYPDTKYKTFNVEGGTTIDVFGFKSVTLSYDNEDTTRTETYVSLPLAFLEVDMDGWILKNTDAAKAFKNFHLTEVRMMQPSLAADETRYAHGHIYIDDYTFKPAKLNVEIDFETGKQITYVNGGITSGNKAGDISGKYNSSDIAVSTTLDYGENFNSYIVEVPDRPDDDKNNFALQVESAEALFAVQDINKKLPDGDFTVSADFYLNFEDSDNKNNFSGTVPLIQWTRDGEMCLRESRLKTIYTFVSAAVDSEGGDKVANLIVNGEPLDRTLSNKTWYNITVEVKYQGDDNYKVSIYLGDDRVAEYEQSMPAPTDGENGSYIIFFTYREQLRCKYSYIDNIRIYE